MHHDIFPIWQNIDQFSSPSPFDTCSPPHFWATAYFLLNWSRLVSDVQLKKNTPILHQVWQRKAYPPGNKIHYKVLFNAWNSRNVYTAKLLFHQSPTRHSDHTVTTTVTM